MVFALARYAGYIWLPDTLNGQVAYLVLFPVLCVLAMLCVSERFAKAATLAFIGASVLAVLPMIFYQCNWWDWWCYLP